MKRKIIVLTFMLSFLGFISKEMQAQTDAYFSNSKEFRSSDAVGAGLGFDGFSEQFGQGFYFTHLDEIIGDGFQFDNLGDDNNCSSLEFSSFDMSADDVPLNDGMLFLLGLALIWILGKRKLGV